VLPIRVVMPVNTRTLKELYLGKPLCAATTQGLGNVRHELMAAAVEYENWVVGRIVVLKGEKVTLMGRSRSWGC
jgi:hypothetical protein